MTDDVTIRAAEPGDSAQVIELLRISLGKGNDPLYGDFFRWKHELNPFGASPAWVALADGEVVGFRTFMRWEFVRDEEVVRAVRAVDTATAPSFRGRGIFSSLTRVAVADLEAEGVDMVFNTPNAQSRPGYLKMGWQLVGRLPVLLRPRGLTSARAILRARTAANLWSEPTSAGVPLTAASALHLKAISRGTTSGRLRTRHFADYISWRYGFEPLHYRIMHGPGGDWAVFRVRKRGAAAEAVIAEASAGSAAGHRALVRAVLGATGADYAIMIGSASLGAIPVPAMGPTLTCLPLGLPSAPALPSWDLQMGDVEMF